MSEREEERRTLLERLETEREELKLQIGLAKLEAKEEWEELEQKIEGLRGRLKVLGSEARETSGELGAAFDMVADEIREGFARIRKLL
ncbi:MAG TPA: hypothetical protein VK849_13525 [Longimicrobiales bacterium]|nr:hypothetical protein [Longimicrobiales bacterium]